MIDVSFAPLALKLKQPIQTARGPMLERLGWIVTARAGGVEGRGEVMPLEGFGTESLDAARRTLERFRGPARLDTVEDVEVALQGVQGTPATRFGLECALLEHLARQSKQSVASLLAGGAPLRRQLVVNTILEGEDAAGLARSAEAAMRAGYKVVKVKVAARPLAIEAQRLLAIRRVVGDGVQIRIDANGGWTEANARSALRGLEALNLELCEQPVGAADIEGLRRLRRQVPCQIAADESVLRPGAVDAMLALSPAAAVDVLVLKPMALGGLLPTLRLALDALPRGVHAYVTTLMDGPLARAAAAQLAAVLPADGYAHGLATVELFADVLADPYTPRDGVLTVPDAPGWGLPT